MTTQQTQPTDDVVRKIQKMLSLATGVGTTAEEAASAMAMAQKMLARYNLDYHTVQAAQVVGGTNTAEEERTAAQVPAAATYKWQRDLWAALAAANFCWHWVVEAKGISGIGTITRQKRHMLLGSSVNMAVVQSMGLYLCATMERLLPYPPREAFRRPAMSWRAGCAERLCERIRAQYLESQKRPKTAENAGTALALFDVAKREEKANWDAKYGKGAWDAKERAEAEWKAGAEERRKAQVARDLEEERDWLAYLQTETAEQKKGRERLEAKEALRSDRAARAARNRDYRRWAAEDRREASKVDWSAKSAGSKAGEGISLSRQVGEGRRQGRLG